jgi:hypothetical protein
MGAPHGSGRARSSQEVPPRPHMWEAAGRAVRSVGAVRDTVVIRLSVPGVLALAAALDIMATLGTNYGSLGRSQAILWLVVTLWALWRTYRRGPTARRVARALYGLGVLIGLVVVLPGFTSLDHRSWWVASVFCMQVWNLLAVTSGPVRTWVGEPPRG